MYKVEPEKLTFFEYDSISKIQDSSLKEFVNRELKKMLENSRLEIFTFDSQGYIKFRQFVGLITLYDKNNNRHIYIEVLPKIYKYNSKVVTARRILLKMLEKYLDVQFFKSSDRGKINLKNQNMFEIYVILFLEYLKKLSLGLKRKYQFVESNINTLKGRLLFAKHINKNLFNPTRFYTRHEEFTLDIPENRILKTAITKMHRAYKNILSVEVEREFKKYLVLFSDVPESSNIHADLLKSNIDKTFIYYEDAFKLAKLFLTQHTLINTLNEKYNKKNEEEVGLIFDMNLLFEKYVAKKLKEYLEPLKRKTEIEITEQESKHSIISDQSQSSGKNNSFKIVPDIVVRVKNNLYILDTKWKEIDLDKPNYNISQQDLYQMLSYASIYREAEKSQEISISIILIYPKTENFNSELKFTFNDTNKTPLKIFPFDLFNPESSLKSLCNYLFDSSN
ncbi:MAG: McrC family protein [Minisyncoccia bacterium]